MHSNLHIKALAITTASMQDRIRDATMSITACEAAIRHLESTYMQHILPDDWVGAEWWIQVVLCPLTSQNVLPEPNFTLLQDIVVTTGMFCAHARA